MERAAWIVAGSVLMLGLVLFAVWPWLWLLRDGVFVFGGGWVLYRLTGWVLDLRGTFLEQQKHRHIVEPIDGRLPAWIDNTGNILVLEAVAARLGDSRVRVMEEMPPLPELPPRRPVAPEWGGARRDFRLGEIVLGYGLGGALLLPTKTTKSIAIVGKSGTGKSNTERFLLGQYDDQGAEHSIWDGHGDISAELGGLTEYPDMLADCDRIWGIYSERQAAYKPEGGGIRDFPLFVLMIDEWKDMHKALKKTKSLISTLITGGRKYNMHLIISSQYFRAEMFENGTGDLDSIWTRYLHWTDSRQAEYARVSDEQAQGLLQNLQAYGTIGYSIISHPSVETQVLNIPRTESRDLRR